MYGKEEKNEKKSLFTILKKKNKGFTLIELLAVIVILAIIMIIAIPSVLDTMDTARRKTFTEYITKIYTNGEKKYIEDIMKGSGSKCKLYNIRTDLGLNNTGDYNGYIVINKVDGVTSYYITLWDNNFYVSALKYTDTNIKNLTLNDFTSDEIDELSKETLIDASGCTSYSEGDTVVNVNSVGKAIAYEYGVCESGDEDACVRNSCYKNNSENSCAAGTMIDIAVNSNTTLRFNVLFDKGSTLVLQTQSVIGKSNWGTYSSYGPTTALANLESLTNGWTNVNQITYSLGTTVFKNNQYTYCDVVHSGESYSCTSNAYTMDERKARARLITVQEAQSLLGEATWDRTLWSNIYDNNQFLLYNVESYKGYMTSNITYSSQVISIKSRGIVYSYNLIYDTYDLKAVVEVNKNSI